MTTGASDLPRASRVAASLPGRLEAMLDAARASLQRLTPAQARAEQARGALLVDTRTDAQRARQGDLPGAIVIDRTVLEWRLDPASPHRIAELDENGHGTRVVVICRQGYSSSLAARSLQELGLDATDVIGGVEAWLAAGLPLAQGPADVRE